MRFAQRVAVVACAILTSNAPASTASVQPPPSREASLATAWRTLRIVDCARCHGKHYEGQSGPSIVEYARKQSRDLFIRAVLDGTPVQGMPGYRSNPLVAGAIDDIYLYFKARAEGTISEQYRPQSR